MKMNENGEIKLDPDCELFRLGDPEYRAMSPLFKWWMPIGGATTGVCAVMFQNSLLRKPMRSGIQRHFIAAVIGFLIGEAGHRFSQRIAAEKDFQFYHYMTLHPEDFPPPKKILFRDYIEPWFPIR